MSIVNTFIVGMPEAGTTSLHRYLAEHPDTCMADDKEPHYFSVDLLQEGAQLHGHPKYTRYPTSEAYHTLFTDRGSASVVGESSVFYLFSKAAAKEMRCDSSDWSLHSAPITTCTNRRTAMCKIVAWGPCIRAWPPFSPFHDFS